MRRHKKTMFIKQKQRGFSLIEVAIAIVVIGLITSFAMKGKELIHTARLRSVVDQVNMIHVAVQTFVDKYGALPGDAQNAQQILGEGVENGRGDGKIQSEADAKRFWSHLNASELVNLNLINGYPTSKLGGYYSVSTQAIAGGGVWVVFCRGGTNNENFSGILSPEDAYFIDKNSDTGNPNTGDIRTIKGHGASGDVIENQSYKFTNKNEDCVLLFRVW